MSQPNPPILVTGGTGTLGTHVVRFLRQAGRDVRVLTRNDRTGGSGLEYIAGDLIKAAACRVWSTVLK